MIEYQCYLEKFVLPDDEMEYSIARERMGENGGAFGYLENGYPCGMFTKKELTEIDFDKVTIIYGGNGSGKTTLLNLIANKLKLKRVSPFNDSEMFSKFVNVCDYRLGTDDYGSEQEIPYGSMIITSDDIFDYMLAVRTTNEEIAENIEKGKDLYKEIKYGESIKLKGQENYDEFRLQVLSRQKSLSRRKFLQKQAGKEIKLNSNGETAIDQFFHKLKNDMLFCLDEPENSLSPKMQLQLKELIEKKSRYCGCQFIIATHSPFMLSIQGAKIYNLDTTPVSICKWWEVENTKTYFEFFEKNRDLFLKK